VRFRRRRCDSELGRDEAVAADDDGGGQGDVIAQWVNDRAVVELQRRAGRDVDPSVPA
jgi:hypothetical protein